MDNPLRDQGVSDRDYATAIGTLMGEALGQGLHGYAAVADVIANRMANPSAYNAKAATIGAIATAPGQFDAWNGKNSKTAGGNVNAKAGFAAAHNPQVADRLGLKDEFEQAKQGLVGVFGTGQLRGIAQGSTFYQNPTVTAQWGTSNFQNNLANKYGGMVIGDHRFTGPNFTDQPFDNVTYNGQLGMPDVADINFDNVPFASPIGSVDFMGDLPDLSAPPDYGDYANKSFSQPSSEGFSSLDSLLAGLSEEDRAAITATAAPEDMLQPYTPATFEGIDFGAALANLGLRDQPLSTNVELRTEPPNFTLDEQIANAHEYVAREGMPPPQSAQNFDGMSFPDITDGLFNGPMDYGDVANKSFSTDGFSMPDVPAGSVIPGSDSIMDASGFNTGWGEPETTASVPSAPSTSGFHSGVDGWSAPETFGPDMHDAQAALTAQGRIDNFADHQLPGISYGNQDKINASVMAELSPSSGFHAGVDGWEPSTTTQTAWGPTPSASVPSVGTIPQGDLEAPSTVAPRASTPAPASSFTQRAAQPREAAPQEQFGGFSPSEYADQVSSTFGVGKPGSGFMDAMANPSLAASYGKPSNDFGLGNLFGKSTPDVGFMNAMASPQHAANYSPGMLDGWTGGMLKGAALGALTGGIPGALMGGAFGGLNLDGRLGSAFSNQFGGFGLGPSWDGYDASTMGYGFGFNDRGERSHTGEDRSGNATVGDGSFSGSSGYNDNSPQGIL